MPELDAVVIAGGGSQITGAAIRQRCEVLRGTLELERGTFLAQWKEIGMYLLPRRPRFTITDRNKGDRRNQNIIDSTAIKSLGTLSAGMMSGLTSPARPWFRLLTGYPDLDEQKPVQEYLHEVQERMQTAFLRSNLYNQLPLLYTDMGGFGTGAMAMLEDDETVFRFATFPIGTYSLANDKNQQVRTFIRTFDLTVMQMVQQFGNIDPTTGQPDFLRGQPTTLSLTVQNLWNRNNLAAWISVVHVVRENLSYDGKKIEKRFKKYEDIYYELGSPNQPIDPANMGLLQHGGFDEFPIMAGRWEVNAEDVYATNSPGITAIGDIKQLQMGEKRSAQGIEKSINPPLTGPSSLTSTKVSVLPGDVTYHDVSDAKVGLRPIYTFDFAQGIKALEGKQQQVRERIKSVFFEDLFMMFADSDRREITATEIMEKKEEKLLGLGPVLWQFNQDVLDPVIDRAFSIMLRKNLLPPAPPELAGVELHVEYISIMAQAQKSVGIAAIERFVSFVSQIAQTDPRILDNVDDGELIEQYADATGVPPKILRSADVVAKMRAQQAQAQQQQQQAENAPKLAGAAKDLGATPSGGQNVLATLLARSRARQTISGTQGPPPSVLPQ